MTDTKPDDCPHNSLLPSCEICELRAELERIQSAEMPVEPHREHCGLCGAPEVVAASDYDALKAYAQRKDAELNDERKHSEQMRSNALGWREYFEAAEKEKAALIAENEGMRKLLTEAAEDIEDWGSYASEYFQNKHDLAGNIKKYREAAIKEQSCS